MLRAELGEAEPAERVELEEVALRRAAAAAAGDRPRPSTRRACSPRTSSACAARRASSYPDLIRLRTGTLEAAPDAVVMPGSAEQVAALLEVCARERVAVVPFGGGTSVVGGVEPLAGRARAGDRARPAAAARRRASTRSR